MILLEMINNFVRMILVSTQLIPIYTPMIGFFPDMMAILFSMIVFHPCLHPILHPALAFYFVSRTIELSSRCIQCSSRSIQCSSLEFQLCSPSVYTFVMVVVDGLFFFQHELLGMIGCKAKTTIQLLFTNHHLPA